MKIRLIGFILFLLFSLPSFAQEKIFVFDQNTPKRGAGFILSDFTYCYVDSTNKLRFEDISKAEFLQKMKIHDWQNRQMQVLNINYWYKTTIVNRGYGQINFTYEPSYLGENDFYILSKKGVVSKKSGQDIPLKDRAWSINPNALLLELSLNDTLTVFTRASSQNEMKWAKDIWLGEIIPYYEGYISDNFPQILFQGAILIMFFYNLIFCFLSLSEIGHICFIPCICFR